MSEQENDGTEGLRSFLVPDGPRYTVAVPEAEYEALCAAKDVAEARAAILAARVQELLDLLWRVASTYRPGSVFREEIVTVLMTAQGPQQQEAGVRATVVCLCGSTRFLETFREVNRKESLEGRIVLTVELVNSSEHDIQDVDPEQKAMLDELHLQKIDLADEILVLNVGGYIGESTKREIAYAREHDKPIRWLEANHDH